MSREHTGSKSAPDWIRMTSLILLGSLLACGRFDWAGGRALALRSYCLSWFFFVLILVCGYTLARTLRPAGRRGLWPALTAASVLLNLPYRWLRLEKFYYLKSHPLTYRVSKGFVPEWLGRGGPAMPWNATDTLFVLALGAGLAWLATLPRAGGAPSSGPRRPRRLFALIFILIVLETWLHLSNRSPYSYIPHFEQPAAANYTYSYELLPDGRGVVNADFGYFVRLEELFRSNYPTPPMLMVRRIFSFYLDSHLSYFIGPYHSFLILNIAFWTAGAAAMYFFCRDLTGSDTCASSAAFLVACSPGFIMYAAQPMSYVSSYAELPIVLFLYRRIVIATGLRTPVAATAAGILLGLALLTYDSQGWALFFIAYPMLLKTSPFRALAPAAIGALIYSGFFVLLFNVFKLVPEHLHDKLLTDAVQQSLELFRHPAAAKIFPLFKDFFWKYFVQILQVNFYVPVALAVGGLLFAKNGIVPRATALLLLLPTLATFAILHFGGCYLSTLSRFNYPTFPAVVLLASMALDRLAANLRDTGRFLFARLSVALPLALCAAISNIDAFGFAPQLYYHFYWQSGGTFS